MELKGRIIQILPLQTGEGKNGPWQKQDYILETMESYPKKVCFNLWGDRINQFAIKQDEVITVHFDIESREFNGRWYTDVKAWRIDRNLDAADTPPPAQGQAADMPPPVDFGDADDDLPF